MLTVKELIVKLKHYNPKARVVVEMGEYNDDDDYEREYDYLYRVNWRYDDDGKTNKNFVVIS
jgi:hypothetical protein